jgi:hypothetical protein
MCIEIAKENLKPADFWRNYKELLLTDEEHWKEVIETVKKTSEEYQKELTNVFES